MDSYEVIAAVATYTEVYRIAFKAKIIRKWHQGKLNYILKELLYPFGEYSVPICYTMSINSITVRNFWMFPTSSVSA